MIREIVDIYSRNTILILLLSSCIVFPITVLGYFGTLMTLEIDHLATPTYFSGLLLLINFIICAPPFLKLVLQDMADEKMTFQEGTVFFIKQLGPMLFLTILIYIGAIYSMWLLFIPTILLLTFLMVLPYFSDEKQMKKMIKKTIQKIVDENFGIAVDVIIVVSISLLAWGLMMLIMQNYENSIYGYMALRGLLNALTLPLIYIYLSVRYRATKTAERFG